uniref:Uncharacterized protein n=1 Tax=Timema cristinae TaxID=61476 RepID=A0A7R9CUZ5_TIMCR|nr:unnamed protein product [Timema cristinae]
MINPPNFKKREEDGNCQALPEYYRMFFCRRAPFLCASPDEFDTSNSVDEIVKNEIRLYGSSFGIMDSKIDHFNPADKSEVKMILIFEYFEHVVGLFPSRNFYAQVMFSSNSKRLILTVPQRNLFFKEMLFWSDSVENCVNLKSNMYDFSIVGP